MPLLIPVSLGELIDKITILEIKTEKIKNVDALKNIQHELDELRLVKIPNVDFKLILELKIINTSIWIFEDDIRRCETEQDFGVSFINMARTVHMYNDKRASIKKRINILYNSDLVEEKSHKEYNIE